MPTRPVTLLLVPLLALLTACGAESVQPANSRTDVSQLLRDTFANLARMKSADVALRLRLPSPSARGPVSAEVTGPFATTGQGTLPRFALQATVRAAGRSQRVGATWTGDKAFVTLQSTSYAVADLVARQFAAAYQEALRGSDAQQAQGGLLLSSLGIDFTKWLQRARNAGMAQVGDAQTVEITGRADVPRLVGDLERISRRAQSLGLPSGPAQPTPRQRRQLVDAMRSVDVRIYTGAQDRILRRLAVHAVVRAPAATAGSDVDLDLRFTRVNQDQQISAPANAEPFSRLLKVTGALNGGGLGALLGGGSASAPASVPSGANAERYAKCVQKASGDKARRCAAVLTG